ncbi:MAG: hypothetical protein IIW16_01635, partial [Clostridia bacterium]|nr:hypothetical protein [Clostridia bacterium]
MKKLSLPKRILSFVLVGALLVGLFCGNLVANAATETDTKTVSFSVLDGDTAGTLSNSYEDNPLGTAIGYAFNGYSYYPDHATDSMVWNYQNISEFCIYGLGNKAYNDDTYNSFYKFSASSDGVTYTPLTITTTVVANYTGNYRRVKVTPQNIPSGTNYIKLTSEVIDTKWNKGVVLGATITYNPTLTPEFTVLAKNIKNEYANPVADAATVTRDTLVKVDGLGGSGAVTIKKDGTAVTAADYYNSTEKGYIFKTDGTYEITATNSNFTAGKTFSFTLAKKEAGTLVYTNTSYNYFEQKAHGATTVTGYSNMSLNVSIAGANKASLYPNLHGGYVIWNVANLSGFAVETISTDESFDFANTYIFTASADGDNWTSVPYDIAETVPQYSSSHPSCLLTLKNIPDGTNYIRLTNNYQGGIWEAGFIKVHTQTKVLAPEVSAIYKNLGGIYANMVEDGGVAKRATMLKITEMALGGTVKITKNGEDANLEDYYDQSEDVYLFNEDGEYKVTAENVVGKSELSFTVKLNKNEPVYTEDIKVFDIFNKKDSGTIENTYHYNPIQNALTGKGSRPVIHSYYPN